MGKFLVIVESPVKAKTINKFLGNDYIVKPTGGHVVDLPPKEFGIDVDHDFALDYTVIKGKARILQDLKKTAGQVDTVLLATDPDREGEAIAWHVARNILKKDQPYFRVLINQITRDAVIRAVENKGELDLKKVNAQQARRVLDRLVGYKISPILWKTLYSGLSAGRVQSVALRLIVERDSEIEAFTPVEFWNIKALLATAKKEEFEAKLVKKSGKTVDIKNAAESEVMIKELSGSDYSVSDITK
ncbi:MAG: DNA topoisomerase, partial [Candidatus Latescibacterota bacterium]